MESKNPEDPHNLRRFITAQASDYERALAEIKSGQKRSHWMWYVFPQFAGLGYSATSERYAIGSVAEAEAYLRHPVLGPRLREITEAVLRVEGRSARAIFGSPDDVKLRSSMTLFAHVSAAANAASDGEPSVFDKVLNRYFAGEWDGQTLRLIAQTQK